jgi:hypothetical protein
MCGKDLVRTYMLRHKLKNVREGYMRSWFIEKQLKDNQYALLD